MPLHRARKASNNPADDLQVALEELERAGEQVVQVISAANEWLIYTAPQRRPQVETRSSRAAATRKASK